MNSLAYETMVNDETKRLSEPRRAEVPPKVSMLRPFGRSGAARYDDDTRGMPRRYHTAHSIQNHLVLRALKTSGTPRPVVLDLGCGTANDGLDILSSARGSVYFGIDYSNHMLARAATKLTRRGYRNRNLLLCRDFRELRGDELLTMLNEAGLSGGITCVISAIALHHYYLEEKRSVYRLAYDVLPKTGLLVLNDLYSNDIGYCADWAWLKELRDIRNVVGRMKKRIHDAHRGPRTISERHYREENRPQVLSQEISLLQNTGFDKVEVVYRYGQLGVLAVEK